MSDPARGESREELPAVSWWKTETNHQGMYPTAIILLVALNKSHFEGTTRGDVVTCRSNNLTARAPVTYSTRSLPPHVLSDGGDKPQRRGSGTRVQIHFRRGRRARPCATGAARCGRCEDHLYLCDVFVRGP